MKPQVTVIVTVHKRTEFLTQALESALAQTFREYEIIVADDSGTAAARSLCEQLVSAGRIRYHANPQTLGVVANVRAVIEDAQGEFVSILNDDDLWEPNFLAELVPPLQQDEERALAFSDHWIISEDGSIDETETDANTRRYGRAALAGGDLDGPPRFVLIQNGVPLAMAAVFRKRFLNLTLLTDEIAGAYDFWISCLLAASGKKFYYVPKRLTRYRVHSRTETGRRDPNKSQNQVYIFDQLLKHNWFPNLDGYLRARLSGAFFRLGRDRLYFNQLAEARRCFSKALRTHSDWRPILGGLLSYLPKFVRVRLNLSEAG